MELLAEHEELRHLIPNPDKVLHRYGIPDLTGHQIKKEDGQILKMITLLVS